MVRLCSLGSVRSLSARSEPREPEAQTLPQPTPPAGYCCVMPRRDLLAIDLFCGAGGLTRGLRRAGFRVSGAIELDLLAASTYRSNFPEVRLWEADIRSVPVTKVMSALKLRRGRLDLLAACPPCEGFSTMRTRNGYRRPRDERNDLVFELIRFIRGLHPKVVMIENVPGLARNYRLAMVKRAMKDLGYRIRCEVVDAADFGVPQRRRRLLVVASRLGELPERPLSRERSTVRDWIGYLPPAGRSGDPLHDHGESRSDLVGSLIRRIPTNGGGRLDLPARSQLQCHRACDGFKDVYGRMSWDDVAPTITGGCVNPSKGRFLHPSKNRSITLREAALLQTFPKVHKFSLERGKFAAAELIGNALPPLLVEVQARSVASHIRASE